MKAGALVVAMSCFCGFFVVLLIIHWPMEGAIVRGAVVVLLGKVCGRLVVLLMVFQGLAVVLLVNVLGDVVVLLRLFCFALRRRNSSLVRLLGPWGALSGDLVLVLS